MPRHINEPPVADETYDDLLASLVKELKDPRPIGLPVILEDHTPATNSRRIHVIWDRWEECDRVLHSEIILEAYRKACGDEYRKQITLTLGLTVPEAVGMGLLPFKIVAARQRAQLSLNEEYRQVMLAAGAIRHREGDELQLRCATREDAESTVEHLEKALPHSRWSIIEETPVYDD